MLVLTRKEGQQINLGDHSSVNAIIHIGHVRGGSVRIGIEANKSINIARAEIDHRKPVSANGVEKYYKQKQIEMDKDLEYLAEWNSWSDASSWEPIGESLYLDDIIKLIQYDMDNGTESSEAIYKLLMAGVRDYISTVIENNKGL